MSAINKEKPPKVNPNGIKVKMKTKAKSNNLLNYPFGEVVIPDTDLTPDAFIYKFLHILTGRWYIGMHGLKEHESPFDGTYWNSSTDDDFKVLLEEKPEEFRYEILHYGSLQGMFKLENKILTELDAGDNPMSWNKWNGIFKETDEPPRLKLIDQLAKDAYDIKSDLERKVELISDVLVGLIRLQVRFDTSFSKNKISDYRNEMTSNNSTKGFTITILRSGGLKILVGGNHTLEAAKKLLTIEVVYIDEDDLSEEELQALGNALNRRVEIQRLTTEISDCASDLVALYKSGKITDDTFKDKYCTEYIKITGGFKGTDISKVRQEAKYMIADEASWKTGKKWITWSDNDFKHEDDNGDKYTRVQEKEQLSEAKTDNSTLCVTQSATFRTDRVIEKWIKDTKAREKVKKKPKSTILVLMHYKDQKVMNKYYTDGSDKVHKRILLSFLKGEGIKNPKIEFENLEFWEDKIS